jgi:RNA polymerase sigma factor (sigma-70 family)
MQPELSVLMRCLDAARAEAAPSDRELLARYAERRDEDAFALLVQRHGPLVWGACRRALSVADAEDVYQATFLVLARKAGAAWQECVGPWLHAVATRLAKKARAQVRAAPAEAVRTAQASDPLDGLTARELLAGLDEEMAALPAALAGPVLLCLVQGHTQPEAARLLGVSVSAVRRRLEKGRARLARRLQRRGLTLGLLALPAGAPPLLVGASGRVLALANAAAQPVVARVAAGVLVLLGVVGLALAGTSRPPEQGAPDEPARAVAGARQDRLGDALPPEAMARLGTQRLRVGGKPVAVAFAPGGRMLAGIAPRGGVTLWEVPSGKEVGHLAGVGNHHAAAFAHDGKRLAVAVLNEVIVYDVGNKPAALGDEKFRFTPQYQVPLRFVAFRRDGSLLVGTHDGRLALHDATGAEVRQFGKEGVKQAVYAVSADGKTVAVAGEKTATLYNVERGVETGVPGLVRVAALAFAPDGKHLALGDETNTIRLWDVAEKTVARRLIGVKAPGQLRGVGDTINGLAFAPDGATLYSVGDYGDGTVRVWDTATGKQTRSFQSHHGDGELLTLSDDGTTLAVAGKNGAIRLWDTATGKQADAPLGTQGAVLAVAADPAGRELVTSSTDGVVYVWDRTGKPVRQWRAHERYVSTLAFGGESGKLFTAGAYEPAKLWDSATAKPLREYAGSTGSVRGVGGFAVNADGSQVILFSNDRKVQLVEAATGKVQKVLAEGSIDRFAFSPDGKFVAGGGFDKHVHLWEIATGKEVWAVPLPNSVAAVAFAPDGKQVAAGCYGGATLLFDRTNGLLAAELGGRTFTVRAVAFSPDGRLLAASGDTPEVTLYEVATRLVVRQLAGHRGPVLSLAFTPDSRALVSGSHDGTALVWDVAGELLPPRKPPTEAELDALWAALGDDRAVAGYDAALMLSRLPDEAAKLVPARMVLGKDLPQAVMRWLNDLDGEEFAVRERASTELGRLGKGVEKELRQARAATKSVEVAKRLDALLAALDGAANEAVRGRRVVAALELANTQATRRVLELLVREAATTELRRSSQEALARLERLR